MPFDAPATIPAQTAFDIAGFLATRVRPDFPGKELDWPNGDAPPDVAYPTRAGSLSGGRSSARATRLQRRDSSE